MSLSTPFPFRVAAEQKAARVEVNISLAFRPDTLGELTALPRSPKAILDLKGAEGASKWGRRGEGNVPSVIDARMSLVGRMA